ncbi:MAG TPA: hypothetical protein VF200_14330 [Woeseiaceae bacterium]
MSTTGRSGRSAWIASASPAPRRLELQAFPQGPGIGAQTQEQPDRVSDEAESRDVEQGEEQILVRRAFPGCGECSLQALPRFTPRVVANDPADGADGIQRR